MRGALSDRVRQWKTNLFKKRFHRATYQTVFASAETDVSIQLTFDQWYERFEGCSVIVVGNSPNLLGRKLGAEIDRFDLIIRLNLTDPSKTSEDLGTRTDVRFVGATMLDRHIDAVAKMERNSLLISTQKNYSFFSSQGIGALFYDRGLPNRALSLLSEVEPTLKFKEGKLKPPRSGVVALAMLLSSTNPARLALAGFSATLDSATKSIRFEDNSEFTYDLAKYEQNHCGPEIELRTLLALNRNEHFRFL